MELNGLIFPAPSKPLSAEDFLGELIWVPVRKPSVSKEFFLNACKRRIEQVAAAQTGLGQRLLREPQRPLFGANAQRAALRD